MNCCGCCPKRTWKKKNVFIHPRGLPLRQANENDYNDRETILVLVFTLADMISSLKRSRIDYYMSELKKCGLKLDCVQALTVRDVVFVKVSADEEVLLKYAVNIGVALNCDNPYFQEKENHDHGVQVFFKMRSESSLKIRGVSESTITLQKEMTSSERIQILYQLLRLTKYGYAEEEVGIQRLLGQGTFASLYPLHEPMIDRDGFTDRFLLCEIWASWKYILRRQPTFLIQKYLGSEVGFYFAYLNHYARMLIPAAIIGLLYFLTGILSMGTENNFKSKEICDSDLIMCATCIRDSCEYKLLNASCPTANFNHIIDNQATVIYGIFISIWSTVSFELWKREQSSLLYQWNLFREDLNVSVRPEYENTATLRRLSPVTGDWEPYQDPATKLIHQGVSALCLVGMAAISIAAIVGLMINYYFIYLSVSSGMPTTYFEIVRFKMTTSLISVVLMMCFDKIDKSIAIWLVELENPRTEMEYDNSYIMKIYTLTFVNSFGVAIYIAFFKGKFRDFPGHTDLMNYNMDKCDPTGCAENLFLHVFVVLMVKCVVKHIVNYAMIQIRKLWRQYKIKRGHGGRLPAYENEYYLSQPTKFFLVDEYKEIAIHYGYVTFFSSAQPLAPLIVLLHVLTEIRMDAHRMMTNFRRPVPICVQGIQAWMEVFTAMTHLGVVSNALVIGWTMTFVPTQIYQLSVSDSSYYEWRLGVFDTNDYGEAVRSRLKNSTLQPSVCRYTGMRYPPGHEHQYQHRGEYWMVITWIMGFIIIFEHVVLAITSIISYAIPDIPHAIKQLMEYENLKSVKEKYQTFGENAEEGNVNYRQ